DAEVEDEMAKPNPVEVLRAITRLASRVRVFVDRGQIGAAEPRWQSKLSNLFDRIVREVAFEQGCFHPKVWVARYTPQSHSQCARSATVGSHHMLQPKSHYQQLLGDVYRL